MVSRRISTCIINKNSLEFGAKRALFEPYWIWDRVGRASTVVLDQTQLQTVFREHSRDGTAWRIPGLLAPVFRVQDSAAFRPHQSRWAISYTMYHRDGNKCYSHQACMVCRLQTPKTVRRRLDLLSESDSEWSQLIIEQKCLKNRLKKDCTIIYVQQIDIPKSCRISDYAQSFLIYPFWTKVAESLWNGLWSSLQDGVDPLVERLVFPAAGLISKEIVNAI